MSEDLLSNWEYEDWKDELKSKPTRLVSTHDKGQPYEMGLARVFELEDGKFALVTEDGCSCYDSSWANITLFDNEAEAMDGLKSWIS